MNSDSIAHCWNNLPRSSLAAKRVPWVFGELAFGEETTGTQRISQEPECGLCFWGWPARGGASARARPGASDAAGAAGAAVAAHAAVRGPGSVLPCLPGCPGRAAQQHDLPRAPAAATRAGCRWEASPTACFDEYLHQWNGAWEEALSAGATMMRIFVVPA